MDISEATENYLETILMISLAQATVRAADICTHMGHSRPTVSVALRQFRQKGLVCVDEENYITLTPQGKAVAERIFERHTILANILTDLGVPPKTALEDACKIEHDLSDLTFDCLKQYYLRHHKKPCP